METDMESTVKTELRDRIGILTLNRPEQFNALTDKMLAEFREAIDLFNEEANLKALVLTGNGTAFCAGADLGMLLQYRTMNYRDIEKKLGDFYSSLLSITKLKIPTIAAINGAAIGAGASLAMACDMRFASQKATIGFTFIKLGVNPGMATEFFLNRLIGPAKTMELLLTGDTLSANEAYQLGLVNQVVPHEKVMEDTLQLAGKIAQKGAFPLRIVKENTMRASNCTMDDLLGKQAVSQAICFQMDDLDEGIKAAQEKRNPVFSDK